MATGPRAAAPGNDAEAYLRSVYGAHADATAAAEWGDAVVAAASSTSAAAPMEALVARASAPAPGAAGGAPAPSSGWSNDPRNEGVAPAWGGGGGAVPLGLAPGSAHVSAYAQAAHAGGPHGAWVPPPAAHSGAFAQMGGINPVHAPAPGGVAHGALGSWTSGVPAGSAPLAAATIYGHSGAASAAAMEHHRAKRARIGEMAYVESGYAGGADAAAVFSAEGSAGSIADAVRTGAAARAPPPGEGYAPPPFYA
eukprot:CAMPEP_0203811470 /NCGR_PEP_ID=MMETSP0115-20131106/3582_1 /ASSEMBLY_ACC=CAM_ASM_000227 /TAXON_ID=33651 /ORGANISM="Bicosoecid sp, Strain ms1" /LENGTH=252 /DNA_ID=CAMNT_0050720295 /DNA_START=15 /DNA_END=770 /DNA_ORIENTATION=-